MSKVYTAFRAIWSDGQNLNKEEDEDILDLWKCLSKGKRNKSLKIKLWDLWYWDVIFFVKTSDL